MIHSRKKFSFINSITPAPNFPFNALLSKHNI